jgi:hypothetical protein
MKVATLYHIKVVNLKYSFPYKRVWKQHKVEKPPEIEAIPIGWAHLSRFVPEDGDRVQSLKRFLVKNKEFCQELTTDLINTVKRYQYV